MYWPVSIIFMIWMAPIWFLLLSFCYCYSSVFIIISSSSIWLARLNCTIFSLFSLFISFLPSRTGIILERLDVCDWRLTIFVGFVKNDEQHIMQKTTARNKYPVLEKLLELDLDLTSLNESILSSSLSLNDPMF